MSFFKDVSLRSAGTDLISFFRTTGTHSPWLFLAACVPTAIIIYTFYIDTLEKAKPPPPLPWKPTGKATSARAYDPRERGIK